MHISKNAITPKEIIVFKKFNAALKRIGGDGTPPPIHVEASIVIQHHIALRGTLLQKTRGLPYNSHKSPHFILMSFRSPSCKQADSGGKLQVHLQRNISSSHANVMTYTGSAILSSAITLNLSCISSLFFMESPLIKWELTPISLMDISKGCEGEIYGIWLYLQNMINITGLHWQLVNWKQSGCGYSNLRMWRQSNEPRECNDCKMDRIQEQMRTHQSEIEEL